jgi:hypothetical protein
MGEDTLLLPGLSPVEGKQLQVAFDGGLQSSDGGVLLLREVDRRLGLAERLAACIPDWRDPESISHTLAAMLRFRMFAIAAGYEDADDCDALRSDPIFKLAVGRGPQSGEPLCSQPTMSRLENRVSWRTLIRLQATLIDQFCASWAKVPAHIVLDIDDTWDAVHGGQQLAFFNAHHDGYGFLPIHIYEASSGKLVAAILRPGKTPTGQEVRKILQHVIRRLRKHWPGVAILVRGDGHYSRPEAMDWCEDNSIFYAFGLGTNAVLAALAAPLNEDAAVRRALKSIAGKLRRYGSFAYAAKGWRRQRRVVSRIEASAQGTDTRFVVTNLTDKPKRLYERVYCARGQMENLIKAHKRHLASDRTSCTSAFANQFRLVLHSAAYVLLHALRAAAPRRSFWRRAQFDTLRLRLLKLGTRVVETATRIRVMLPAACPDKAIFAHLAGAFAPSGP